MAGKYKEIRKIHYDSLRNLCVRKKWYTRGSSADYEHLLCEMTCGKQNLTTEDMAAIALDIIEHSSNLDADDFERVAFELTRIAEVFITQEEVADE